MYIQIQSTKLESRVFFEKKSQAKAKNLLNWTESVLSPFDVDPLAGIVGLGGLVVVVCNVWGGSTLPDENLSLHALNLASQQALLEGHVP